MYNKQNVYTVKQAQTVCTEKQKTECTIQQAQTV